MIQSSDRSVAIPNDARLNILRCNLSTNVNNHAGSFAVFRPRDRQIITAFMKLITKVYDPIVRQAKVVFDPFHSLRLVNLTPVDVNGRVSTLQDVKLCPG